jgi:exopolyphosphatase / guanosine-5'-triphosphate,3'-diphosphate pyrophosphatase
VDRSTQGRLQDRKPVAVIDIGSNSIRLVVYEGLSRSPTPLFQEKAMCGLGRYLNSTHQLNQETIPFALASLSRFAKLAAICGVKERDIHPFATAAVRWAEDGEEFLQKAEKACGVPIRAVSNAEEAQLAATGIKAGFLLPSGIVGDLGGGSLELVRLRNGVIEETVSLPLGGLALLDKCKGEKATAIPIIAEALAPLKWLNEARAKPFYAVGGTWRTLAKLFMEQTAYPLTAIHGFALDTRKALQVSARYANSSPAALKRMPGMASGRDETLPYGALVLNTIIRQALPSNVIFSAFGVREGIMYQLLSEAEREKDPLIIACEDIAQLRARSKTHAKELIRWTDALFERPGAAETFEERRLRHAACLLSDMAWRGHPDYRGEQSAVLVAQSAIVGVDHPGRAFLSLCVYHRYERRLSGELLPKLSELIPRPERKRALIVGLAVRLAHTLSAGMAGVLPQTRLEYQDGRLVLRISQQLQALDGEPLRRRLRNVARELGFIPDLQVSAQLDPAKSSLFGGLLG